MVKILPAGLEIFTGKALTLLSRKIQNTLRPEQWKTSGRSILSSGNKESLDLWTPTARKEQRQQCEEIIFQVWRFSQSYPWPEEWFELCRKELEGTSFQEIEKSRWMEFFMKDVRLQAEELSGQLSEALTACEGENGPAAYADRLAEER